MASPATGEGQLNKDISPLFPDKPMIGVAAKAPPVAKTKAKGKGKGKASAKAQVQTALKSDPFAPPHDHDSAFQGGAGPIGGDLLGSQPDCLRNYLFRYII
jgi:hypothetical protein